jgi:hypothetical protein
MTELDWTFAETLTQGCLLSLPVWMATMHVASEARRWLYQAPLAAPVACLLLPYVSYYLIVAFFVQLLSLNMLTWLIERKRAPKRRQIVCITELPVELERRRQPRL